MASTGSMRQNARAGMRLAQSHVASDSVLHMQAGCSRWYPVHAGRHFCMPACMCAWLHACAAGGGQGSTHALTTSECTGGGCPPAPGPAACSLPLAPGCESNCAARTASTSWPARRSGRSHLRGCPRAGGPCSSLLRLYKVAAFSRARFLVVGSGLLNSCFSAELPPGGPRCVTP